MTVPDFTDFSLEELLAYVERELPKASVRMWKKAGGRYCYTVFAAKAGRRDRERSHEDPAQALRLALRAALSATVEGGEDAQS